MSARTDGRRGALALALALAATGALLAGYVALGGGSYKPLEVADPCESRRQPAAEGFEEVSQQILLSALDGAACKLRVTREDLALALASGEGRERFARERRISDEQLVDAVRGGLERAVADAEQAGRLSGEEASLLRAGVGTLPIGTLLEAFRTGEGLLGAVGDLFGR